MRYEQRPLWLSLGTAVLLIVTLVASANEAQSVNSSAPNIIVIMTDQQSSTMMSCTGNKWVKTPSLDALAAGGMRFERAYVANPVCVPARFSIQTGYMPSAIGMRGNKDAKTAVVQPYMIENSLGNLFKKAGYETVFGGKEHFPHGLGDSVNIGYQRLTTDRREELAQKSVTFIKQKHEKPFLLFASFINPHDICYMAINSYNRSIGKENTPNEASRICERILDQARNSGDLEKFVEMHCPPLPENFNYPELGASCLDLSETEIVHFYHHTQQEWTEIDWRLHRWAYCRLTEMVDEKIGRIIAAVKEAGLEENTLIVFTSDHGDMDASHKREHKGVMYEESVRVPFIMSYKNVIPAGVVDDQHFVNNGIDLLPTLCDFAGIEIPQGLAGGSIRAIAEKRPGAKWRDDIYVEGEMGFMVQDSRYKYTVYDTGKHREQLVDLNKDPGEMDNLVYRAEEELVNFYRAKLDRWKKKAALK